jgi:hypothetical protein
VLWRLFEIEINESVSIDIHIIWKIIENCLKETTLLWDSSGLCFVWTSDQAEKKRQEVGKIFDSNLRLVKILQELKYKKL